MLGIINLAATQLNEENLEYFKGYIRKDQLHSARLLIERDMIGLSVNDPKHIVLNEIYDTLINEIETLLEDSEEVY